MATNPNSKKLMFQKLGCVEVLAQVQRLLLAGCDQGHPEYLMARETFERSLRDQLRAHTLAGRPAPSETVGEGLVNQLGRALWWLAEQSLLEEWLAIPGVSSPAP